MRRAATPIFQPSAASSRATCAPMPDEAPMMIAFFIDVEDKSFSDANVSICLIRAERKIHLCRTVFCLLLPRRIDKGQEKGGDRRKRGVKLLPVRKHRVHLHQN